MYRYASLIVFFSLCVGYSYAGTFPATTGIKSTAVKMGFAAGTFLGGEEVLSSDAASITTETNSVAFWASVDLAGTGANVFESQNTVVYNGSYAIKTDLNDTPTANGRFYQDIDTLFALEDGKRYKITIAARHIGTGGVWSIGLGDTSATIAQELINIDSTETTFQQITLDYIHSSNTYYLIARELNATNNGGVYFDAFSLKLNPWP